MGSGFCETGIVVDTIRRVGPVVGLVVMVTACVIGSDVGGLTVNNSVGCVGSVVCLIVGASVGLEVGLSVGGTNGEHDAPSATSVSTGTNSSP